MRVTGIEMGEFWICWRACSVAVTASPVLSTE